MRDRMSWLSVTGVCIWSAAIAWSSSSAVMVQHIPETIPGLDKLYHFLVYGLWGALAAMALFAWRPRLSRAAGLVVVAGAGALFGLSDELHQAFVPGRHADLADLAADVVGVVAGGWVYLRWSGVRRRSSTSLDKARADTTSKPEADADAGEEPRADAAAEQARDRSPA